MKVKDSHFSKSDKEQYQLFLQLKEKVLKTYR